MKLLIFLFFITFSIVSGQKNDTFKVHSKIDTIFFQYKSADYKSEAITLLKEMISVNKKIKENNENYKKLYSSGVNNLTFISIPNISFSKEILNYKDGETLYKYISFANTPKKQEIFVFYNNKFLNLFDLSSDFAESIFHKEDVIKNNKYNSLLELRDESENIGISFLDLLILFKEQFFFKINNKYGFIYNGAAYIIINDNKGLHIIDFNNYFLPNLNYIKLCVQNKENLESFIQYDYKKIDKLYFKIIYK